MNIENENWELLENSTDTAVECPGGVIIDCWNGLESMPDAHKRAKAVVRVPQMLKFIKELNEQMQDAKKMMGHGGMSLLEQSWLLATDKILKELK